MIPFGEIEDCGIIETKLFIGVRKPGEENFRGISLCVFLYCSTLKSPFLTLIIRKKKATFFRKYA